MTRFNGLQFKMVALVTFLCHLSGFNVYAEDQIKLKSGLTVRGEILEETSQHVRIDTGREQASLFFRQDIHSIESDQSHQRSSPEHYGVTYAVLNENLPYIPSALIDVIRSLSHKFGITIRGVRMMRLPGQDVHLDLIKPAVTGESFKQNTKDSLTDDYILFVFYADAHMLYQKKRDDLLQTLISPERQASLDERIMNGQSMAGRESDQFFNIKGQLENKKDRDRTETIMLKSIHSFANLRQRLASWVTGQKDPLAQVRVKMSAYTYDELMNKNQDLIDMNQQQQQLASWVTEALRQDDDVFKKDVESLIQNQDFAEALRLLNQALAKNPNQQMALNLRMDVYAKTRRLDLAIQDISQLLKQETANYQWLFQRGQWHCQMGDVKLCLEDYTKVIALKKNWPEAYNFRGVAYMVAGDLPQALNDFNKAIFIKTDYAQAHNNRGYTLAALEKFEEAIKAYTRAIRYQADYVDAYTNRSAAYMQHGQYALARQDFDWLIERFPQQAQYYYERGFASEQSGDDQAALKDYHVALDLQPQYADVYIRFSHIHLRQNQAGLALENIQRAQALGAVIDPAHLEAIEALIP